MTSRKEITIYDIADKLKLSAATVSRALQDHPAVNKKTKKQHLKKFKILVKTFKKKNKNTLCLLCFFVCC